MNWILIIIIALLFSAFFSGMEIAFVSSNKVRVELDMKQQGMMSKILGLFYGNEEQFISTMLVGNNIALVIYGMGMAALLEPVMRQCVFSLLSCGCFMSFYIRFRSLRLSFPNA